MTQSANYIGASEPAATESMPQAIESTETSSVSETAAKKPANRNTAGLLLLAAPPAADLPQDGRVRAVVHGRKVDLRLSTLPTVHGEKVVMRILDNRSINVKLEDLGFSENVLTIWQTQVEQPHGILLVTGPTGSGKTTTLYSSLNCMDGNKLNIATVEDPIEYHLAAANQVECMRRSA